MVVDLVAAFLLGVVFSGLWFFGVVWWFMVLEVFCWLIDDVVDLVLRVACYYGFDCVSSIGRGFCVFWVVLFVFCCLVVIGILVAGIGCVTYCGLLLGCECDCLWFELCGYGACGVLVC